jgi:hypothetical protein
LPASLPAPTPVVPAEPKVVRVEPAPIVSPDSAGARPGRGRAAPAATDDGAPRGDTPPEPSPPERPATRGAAIPVPVPIGPAPAPRDRPAPASQPAVTVTPRPAPAPNAPDAAPARPRRAPAELRRLTVASKVRGFGDLDPLGGSRVRTGGRFIAYVELVNWPSSPAGDRRATANASYVVRLVDANGLPVATLGPYQSSHTAEEPLVDLYVARVVAVPATLPPGPYSVEVEATDPVTGVKARASVPLAVTAPAE